MRDGSEEACVVTSYDIASFDAGTDAGARISACVVRLTALQLIQDSRWWNRRRRRLMAGALLSCAEEIESAADASKPESDVSLDGEASSRRKLAGGGG